MDTSFVATNIRRIAYQRLILFLVCLGGMVILTGASCYLIFTQNVSNSLAFFIGGAVLGVELGGLFLWYVIRFSRAVRDPLRNASAIGFYPSDARQIVLEQIDQEAAPYAGKIGSFATRHWVISVRPNAFELISLDDEIVWIYKQPRGLLARVVSGWPYAAVVWSRHKRSLALPGSAEEVDQLLQKIAKAIPWVEQGYSKSTLKIWAEPEYSRSIWWYERMKFVEAVDRRREQHLVHSVIEEGFYPGRSSPLAPRKLSDVALQKAGDVLRASRDRPLRMGGVRFMIFGFLWLLLSIARFVHGVYDDSQLGYTFLFLWIGTWTSTIGIYIVVLGAKAEEYAEMTIFKDGLSTTLTVIVFTTLSFAFFFGAPALWKFLGLVP